MAIGVVAVVVWVAVFSWCWREGCFISNGDLRRGLLVRDLKEAFK